MVIPVLSLEYSMQRFAKQPSHGNSILGWRIGKGQSRPLKWLLHSTEMSDEDVCKLLKILATGKSAIGIAVCVETSGCLYKEGEEYEVSSA